MNAAQKSLEIDIARLEKMARLKEYERMAQKLVQIARSLRAAPGRNFLLADRLEALAGKMTEELREQ